MKIFILSVVALIVVVFMLSSTTSPVEAARVRGYYKNSGTYVQPYYRSGPNSYKWDNYSSRGNSNPYTGKRGYKNW